MQHPTLQIRDRLLAGLDREYNVRITFLLTSKKLFLKILCLILFQKPKVKEKLVLKKPRRNTFTITLRIKQRKKITQNITKGASKMGAPSIEKESTQFF